MGSKTTLYHVLLGTSRYIYLAKMVKVYKPGRVCIVIAGRFAGKKAICIKSHEDGTPDRQFEHALIAGIERYPRPVTRKMNAKRIARRCRVKPFFKNINLKHLMPTRYSVADLAFDKAIVSKEATKDVVKRRRAKQHIKGIF